MHAIGLLFAVLGLASGVVLGLNAADLLPSAAPSYTLWVLYPIFSLMGLALFVVPASASQIRATARLGATLHTALAGLAAMGLVLAASGVAGGLLTGPAAMPALWYLLAASLVLAAVWQTCAGSAQAAIKA